MKVLYIGYYKEDSDWGEITRNNILALDKAGVDVACQGISMGKSKQLDAKFRSLESKSLEDRDVCIQHVFPEHIVGTSKFKKNVGILGTNFVQLGHTSAVEKMSLLDEIWLPNTQNLEFLKNAFAGIEKKPELKCVPFAFDAKKAQQQTRDITVPQNVGKFKFYAIIGSDINQLRHILTCFHSEFDESEKVCLTLVSNALTQQQIDSVAIDVKSQLGLNKDISRYCKDTIVADVSDTMDNFNTVHKYGDCFISLDAGNAWPIHVLDAYAFGSSVIASDIGGNKDVVTTSLRRTSQNLISGAFQCYTQKNRSGETNLGKDFYFVPCHKQVTSAMRTAYSGWLDNPVRYEQSSQKDGLSIIKDFDFEQVGNTMKEELDA